jgi:MtN3 and saliva related transmembrane protein
MLEQTLGWAATILFSSMIIPQIVKSIRTKDVSGVSPGFYIIYIAGNIIALMYASMIVQAPLVFKYTFALATATTYLVIYWKYKK